MRQVSAQAILSGVIATGAGESFEARNEKRSFQLNGVTSAGPGTLVCDIEVSNDGSNWLLLGTISLTLSTTEVSDGLISDAPWKYVRGNVTTLTGTDATASLFIGNIA